MPNGTRMFTFLVIKITLVDKEGSLFQVMMSFGEGLPFLCVLLQIYVLYRYLRYSLLDVFVLFVFNFRYKIMESKFRHHYEVIQEVTIFLSFH